jgi:DNA polymerase (family 10)
MNTTASDGKNSIEEMAAAAKVLGHTYIAITDHSKAVTVANGLDEKRMAAHAKNLRAADAKGLGIRVLVGSEVDILKDGSLDYSDETLAELDVVVCSVHSYMNMESAAMTERLLAAIENPYTQIIAHPTGRLLLRREAYPYDLEKVLDAGETWGGDGVQFVSGPAGLEGRAFAHVQGARGQSGDFNRLALGGEPAYIRYGVTTARRGWLTKADVLNTLGPEAFQKALRPKPGSSKARQAGRSR